MEVKTSCFIIMPFSETTEEHTEEYWTSHFKSFLKPLIEEIPSLTAKRSEAIRGDILRQIIHELIVSPIVVADLTDHNPNVFWELGVRQSFKHGTITIAKEGTRLPFDIGVKSTLFYNKEKNNDFRAVFKKALLDCIENPENTDSHVLETITGRGSLYRIINQYETIRRFEGLISENKKNLNLLNFLYSTIDANKKDPKNKKRITNHFRSISIELLISHRYVEAEGPFYQICDLYLERINMMNNQLDQWLITDVSKWFESNKNETYLIFTGITASLDLVYKKLRSQVL